MVTQIQDSRPVIPVNVRETQANYFKFVKKNRDKTGNFRWRRGAAIHLNRV
jgi:hypothetical protein